MKKSIFWMFLLFNVVFSSNAQANVEKLQYQNVKNNLRIEVLQDDLIHVAYQNGPVVNPSVPMEVTPFVEKKVFSGPSTFQELQNGFQTKALKVVVYTQSLCIRIYDLIQNNNLTKVCPKGLGQAVQGLHLDPVGLTHAYGLGQELVSPGTINGDWVAHTKRTPGVMGNQMVTFEKAAVGNTQIPILYGLGQGKKAFGLYLDNVYKQKWYFSEDVWRAVVYGGEGLSFYVMTGPDLSDLRKDYMALTGHPLVPPKKMFGLWLSEYGFDSWQEVEEKKQKLLKEDFPLDGFVLDNQWFGGLQEKSPDTKMGTMMWDTRAFPNPVQTMAQYAKENLGFVMIEEPYVGKNLYEDKKNFQSYLVKDELGEPVYIDYNTWWGVGGMLDYTHPKAAKAWHEWKRKPLLQQEGVLGFWTDLGEPEMYREDDAVYYGGKRHVDVHNLYNFYWNQSIVDGYKSQQSKKRPFIMSRSGGPGSQRLGVAMWSGDIAARLSSLASHYNAQMHMSLSGIDYYGADIGGFWRHTGPEQDSDAYQAMYSLWLANASWTDVPVRPHAFNVDNTYDTSPATVGWRRSNQAQLMRRYQLTPYYYSLAHQAFHQANPLIAPMVYYFQDDAKVREMADQKMVGPWVMVALHVSTEDETRQVYLPQGTWYVWDDSEPIVSPAQGATTSAEVLEQKKMVTLPAYVRAGAIIPTYTFDPDLDHVHVNAAASLVWKLYPSKNRTSFDHYDDDGHSTAYLNGTYNHWLVQQQATDQDIIVSWIPQKHNAPTAQALPQIMEVVYPRVDRVKKIYWNDQLLNKKQFKALDKNKLRIEPGATSSDQPAKLRIVLNKE